MSRRQATTLIGAVRLSVIHATVGPVTTPQLASTAGITKREAVAATTTQGDKSMSEPERVPGRRALMICDRLGWPVTTFRNRPITNLIRYVLHGRKLRHWWRLADGRGLYPIGWVNEDNATLNLDAYSPDAGQSQ